jgi:molybdenum cofactor synthesis domain-containing protein
MVEYTQVSDGNITTNRRVTINENILARGEDISKGQNLLPRGTRIFPQHVALFSMLGIRTISAYRKPKVAFFSTGDELIDLAKKSAKKSTGIFDANRPFIKNMILNLGGIPVDLGIARDRFDAIRNKMKTGLGYDALILSAGSSVGERDYVSKAALSIPGVEMLVHGVAMRPSSPTGIATYRGKPLLLLPGFPTSAIVSFLVFAVPTILGLSGSRVTKLPTLSAKLTEDYTGRQGITHFVRVKVTSVGGTYEAAIVRPTDAQYSGWLRSANGVAIIGETGVVRKDDNVDVFLIGDLAQPT